MNTIEIPSDININKFLKNNYEIFYTLFVPDGCY